MKKNRWAMRTAVSPLLPAMTTLMERSDEPWAMARMLMSWEASESKKVPATPRFSFMPSPTMETIAQCSCTSMTFSSRSRSSSSNSAERMSITRWAWDWRTQKVMVYSELDWVISRMDTPPRLTAAKMRAAIPLLPFMLEPETLTMAVFLRQEMPRTGPTSLVALKGPWAIRVPRAEGLWLLRLQASIPLDAKGARVFGCSTLEPKKESSMASS